MNKLSNLDEFDARMKSLNDLPDPLFLVDFLSAVLMEKKDGSPEKSSSDRYSGLERPPPLASTGGRGNESFYPSNASESREILLPTRPVPDGMRSSLKTPTILPSRPSPARVIPVADRPVNKGKGVVRGSYSERSPPNTTGLKMKRKGLSADTPQRQPCCATCGKYFESWKALFGHLRSHPDRDYRGAFPPPKVSDGESTADNTSTGTIRVIDPRCQENKAVSLINAAATVSSRLNPGNGGRERAMSSSRASQLYTRTPEEDWRSLRRDGLNLDLNAPAPELDSDEEDNK